MKINEKKVVLSKATIKYIKNKYRHLFDSDIEALARYGEIMIKETRKYNGYMLSFEKRCVLNIPENIASHYMVDKEIFIIPDEDGCLYTLVEDTEEKDTLQTYFVILTTIKLLGSNKTLELESKDFNEHPTKFLIERELRRFTDSGYEVCSARVEKRYRLI